MNVYDFDNTIYDGESAFDFYLYCVSRKKSLVKIIPIVFSKLLKYKLCLITEQELVHYIEKYSLKMLEKFPDVELLVNEFWDKNMHKIKPFYLKNKDDSDVILSASFNFLISVPFKRLSVNPKIISSSIDLSTGKVGGMCFRDKKVEAFKALFAENKDISFYTDSMNDKFMIDYSDQAFMVKKNKIRQIKP